MPEQDPPKKDDPKPAPTGAPVPDPEKQSDPIEQDPPKKKDDD